MFPLNFLTLLGSSIPCRLLNRDGEFLEGTASSFGPSTDSDPEDDDSDSELMIPAIPNPPGVAACSVWILVC